MVGPRFDASKSAHRASTTMSSAAIRDVRAAGRFLSCLGKAFFTVAISSVEVCYYIGRFQRHDASRRRRSVMMMTMSGRSRASAWSSLPSCRALISTKLHPALSRVDQRVWRFRGCDCSLLRGTFASDRTLIRRHDQQFSLYHSVTSVHVLLLIHPAIRSGLAGSS